MSRPLRGLIAGLFVCATAAPITLAVTAGPALADATITVTTTTDGGPGSLRQAFADADTNGEATTIVLTAGAIYELDDCETGGALEHTASNSLTIQGNGSTIRQTCEGERVITNVGSAGHLTVDGVLITGGNVGDLTAGGGIGATSAGLAVIDSTISGNSAGSGGAIFVTGGGSATISNSTITDNLATSDTGGGGVETQGDTTLVYATIVGNTAGGTNEPANVRTGGDLVAFGSVIARPLGTSAVDCIVSSESVSHGYNFSDDASCEFDATTDRQDAGDPGLLDLADNGGGTPTMATNGSGSPLSAAIPEAACQDDGAAGITTDQRGLPRPGAQFTACPPAVDRAACTIGAYEDSFGVGPSCVGPSPLPPPPIDAPPRFTG